MKAKFLLIMTMLLGMVIKWSMAVIIIQAPNAIQTPGVEFTIPLKIYGASSTGTPISSANIHITFDTAALSYVGLFNFNALMPASQWVYSGNNTTGIVAANWLEPNLLTVSLPEGSTLYEIKFLAKPGACPLNFIIYEFTDAAYNMIPTTPDHGHYASIQQVSFKVDMRDQTISPDGVYLAGSFNNWSTNTTVMTPIGGSVYKAILPLICDSQYTYKYVNGNTSTGYETVPSACGIPGGGGGGYSRVMTIPANDTTTPALCFSSCDECPVLRSVTFQVDMSEQSISPDGVHLAGSFNGFSTSALPMQNMGNDVFTTIVDLAENETVTFRYVNGNTSAGFETVPASCGTPNGSGSYDRHHMVTQTITLPEVCFSSCDDCAQQPWENDVTFKVDLSQQTISPNGVYIAGTFNNWDPSANQMVPLGNNVYSTTLTFNENDIHNYKFVNGNTATGFETVPAACGIPGTTGGLERQVMVPTNDTILDTVCFSGCGACIVHQVTFMVDMMLQNVNVFGVHLAGSFNNWNTQNTQMDNTTGTTFETTLSIGDGQTIYFRYVNGNTPADMETVPVDCGTIYNGTDYARSLIVTGDTTLDPAMCFSWCTHCPVGFDGKAQQRMMGTIFPNPADSYINIPVFLDRQTSIRILIEDILGKTHLSSSFNLSSGQHVIEINTSNLKNGLYILRGMYISSSETGMFSERLIISR